jgi:8-oxo-dGTP pyrophosphatase MutT (NUDIX family)
MIVVRRGAEVLVLHRSPAGDAYWHVVAGAVEQGESHAEAAARELVEEIGLQVPLVDLEREYVYPLSQESARSRARFAPGIEEVVVRCFTVEAPADWEPTLNEEHDDYRWCTPPEAAELLFWPEPGELVLELAS